MKKFKIIIGEGYEWITFIYIFQDNEGCKFGITNNLERRKKHYRKERPSLELKYFKSFDNRNIARLIEYRMKINFPIISGLETTSASLDELINFIESSNNNLSEAILELPAHLNHKDNTILVETFESKINGAFSPYDKENIHLYSNMNWTKEDDERLKLFYYEGKSTKEISQIFGRNYNSIRARIRKIKRLDKNK